MNFTQKLKKDKKFRFLVIAIAIILVIAFNGNSKKEARATVNYCNMYNTISILDTAWIFGGSSFNVHTTGSNKISCISDPQCYVARYLVTGWFDKYVCLPFVPTGWATDKSEDSTEACETGCYSAYDDEFNRCRQCAEGEKPQTCNANERGVANIVQGMGLNMPCKTSYYLVIFGGGLLMFMAIGMIL